MFALSAPLYATTTTNDLATARQQLAKRSNPARWFITEDGKPTEHLVELLKLDNLYDPNDKLEQIVAKTQKAWVGCIQGQNNKERTDLKDTVQQQEIRQKVEAIVQELGLFDERKPALDEYTYGSCLGAFLDGVRMRLSYLIEEWKKGKRFDELVFFSGERTLRKEAGKEDDIEQLIHPKNSSLTLKAGWKMPENAPYETEFDLCKLVWDQTKIPEDMRAALEGHVVFVNAPRPAGKERPSTKDCYEIWIKEHKPRPGTMLAPSHPVIWTYQQLAGENILGEQYPLDTCAPAATAEMRKKYQEKIVSLVQDTAAKCLYELYQRKKQLTNE